MRCPYNCRRDYRTPLGYMNHNREKHGISVEDSLLLWGSPDDLHYCKNCKHVVSKTQICAYCGEPILLKLRINE